MKDAQSAAGDEGGWGSDSGTRRPNRPLLPLPRTQAQTVTKLGSPDWNALPDTHSLVLVGKLRP